MNKEAIELYNNEISTIPSEDIAMLPNYKRLGGNSGRQVFLSDYAGRPIVAKSMNPRDPYAAVEETTLEVMSLLHSRRILEASQTNSILIPKVVLMIEMSGQRFGFATEYMHGIDTIDHVWETMNRHDKEEFRASVAMGLDLFGQNGIYIDGYNSGLRRNIGVDTNTHRPFFFDMKIFYDSDKGFTIANSASLLERIDFDLPI